MLAETGNPLGAQEQLVAALAIFRELGARPFVERTDRALVRLQIGERTLRDQ
jgi:hypothetical protein